MIVVVDDEREFRALPVGQYCRKVDEAIACLESDMPIEELWLDYDLGPRQRPEDIADWLALHPRRVGKIVLHTNNERGVVAYRQILGVSHTIERVHADQRDDVVYIKPWWW